MDLEALLKELDQIAKQEKDLQYQKFLNGEYFNIFNTLGLKTREVRLHSALIAELLKTDGSHGTDSLLLQEFLDVIGLDREYVENSRGTVKERYIGPVTKDKGGQIDIIIEDGKHALIIENKIYAQDQENQLLRYYNYGRQRFPKGFALLYLTLDGSESDKKSLGQATDIKYIPISYRHHIKIWLERCLKHLNDKPLVYNIVFQYMNLIKELTNQDMSTENSRKIVDLAIDNLEGVVALMDNRALLSATLRKDYVVKPLRDWALGNGLEFICINSDKPGGPAIKFKKPTWNCEIVISRDGESLNLPWQKLYIGVSTADSDKDKEEALEKVKLNVLNCKPTKGWSYGWEWLPEQYSDWHSTKAYIPMKNGDIANWIKDKVIAIVEELETRKLPM